MSTDKPEGGAPVEKIHALTAVTVSRGSGLFGDGDAAPMLIITMDAVVMEAGKPPIALRLPAVWMEAAEALRIGESLIEHARLAGVERAEHSLSTRPRSDAH